MRSKSAASAKLNKFYTLLSIAGPGAVAVLEGPAIKALPRRMWLPQLPWEANGQRAA